MSSEVLHETVALRALGIREGIDKLGEQRQRVVAWRDLGDAVLP
jgi:hypothetical protein